MAASAALDYWVEADFEPELAAKAARIRSTLEKIRAAYPEHHIEIRGKGLIQGLVFRDSEQASLLCAAAFNRGLIMETSGPHDEVAKLMPPLTIEPELLDQGLEHLEEAMKELS